MDVHSLLKPPSTTTHQSKKSLGIPRTNTYDSVPSVSDGKPQHDYSRKNSEVGATKPSRLLDARRSPPLTGHAGSRTATAAMNRVSRKGSDKPGVS